jgi:CheY-like chemotaxis protein
VDELELARTIGGQLASGVERKRAEVRRRQAQEELREADRRKDEFLATLAHELRNPLAPIRNSLEIMKRMRNDARAVEESRTIMERQLRQMVRLIDDLMDVSRITRDKLVLRRERLELASVLQNAVDACRPLMEQSRHELMFVSPEEPALLHADPVRLAQVFGNLLNNAAKYTEPGGRIEVITERRGSEVTVMVRDSGAGIPPQMLSKVFDMFAQVDRTLERSQGGLGIGLHLVKRLVEMHGGSVTAHSDGEGRGSEFIVILPTVALKAAADHAPVRTDPLPGMAARRILVVDDNRDAAESLARLLQLYGNDTRTAADGVQAVQMAAEYEPDVILLDIGMPKMSGFDACRAIRKQPRGKSIIVVALTGWGQEEDRRRSVEAGFDAHLVKPIDPESVLKLLMSSGAERSAQMATSG